MVLLVFAIICCVGGFVIGGYVSSRGE